MTLSLRKQKLLSSSDGLPCCCSEHFLGPSLFVSLTHFFLFLSFWFLRWNSVMLPGLGLGGILKRACRATGPGGRVLLPGFPSLVLAIQLWVGGQEVDQWAESALSEQKGLQLSDLPPNISAKFFLQPSTSWWTFTLESYHLSTNHQTYNLPATESHILGANQRLFKAVKAVT